MFVLKIKVPPTRKQVVVRDAVPPLSRLRDKWFEYQIFVNLSELFWGPYRAPI